MNGLNRIIIMGVLLALLYALWRYQQQIMNSPKQRITNATKKKRCKKNISSLNKRMPKGQISNMPNRRLQSNKAKSIMRGKKRNNRLNNRLVDEESLGGISQLSIGSLEDRNREIYKKAVISEDDETELTEEETYNTRGGRSDGTLSIFKDDYEDDMYDEMESKISNDSFFFR